MSNNFRSDKGVIDFANAVSDYMFRGSREIPFENEDRLIYTKPNQPDTYPHEKAEVYLIRGKRDDETGENPEADFVARKIKTLIANGKLPTGEKIKPEDITVLLRTRTALEDYISALKRHGVYYQYENEDSFYERSEILLMLCLLNVIDNPMRDVYLAGALRSPVFNFTLPQLVAIRQYSKYAPSLYASCKAYDKDDETGKRLKEFFEKTEKYRAECRKLPAHEVIAMLYTELGLLGKSTKEEKKSLLTLYEIARKYESGSYKGLGSFIRYTDKVVNDTVKEHISERNGGCIEIMTVHASKGLQRPVCILCDTARGFNMEDIKKPLYFERFLGVSGYVFRTDGLAKHKTLMRRCAGMAMTNGIVEEEMRKLYVALTRAEVKMIVTGMSEDPVKYKLEMEDEAKCLCTHSALSTTSCLDWIVGACVSAPSESYELNIIDGEDDICEATEQKKEEAPAYSEKEVEGISKILKERFEYKYPYEREVQIPSKLSTSKLSPTVLDSEENEELDQNISLDVIPAFLTGGKRRVTGADVGTATHLFMQFCDFNRLESEGVDKELIRLQEEKYLSDSVCSLVNKGYIKKFIHSPLFSDLKEARRVERELRYNVLLPASLLTERMDLEGESVLVQGVVDCLYEDKDGNMVLVDYKTDSVTEENYRQVLLSRHKNQLTYYKKACEMMLEKPISKVLLYSVPLGKCVPVTQEDK